MTLEFFELDLHPQLLQAIVELGFSAPMAVQEAVIPVMMSGRDIIGQAQTGTGKTAAFALPILHNLEPDKACVQALILAPTRELALQVAAATSEFGRYRGARVATVYGGQAYGPQISKLRRGANIVVGTPGRVLDMIRKEILDIRQVRTVVLDEADEMLSMGFIEDIETILAETPAGRQTALFSATLPLPIRRLAERYLNNPHTVAIHSEQVTVDTIEQRYYVVNENDKLAALTRLFEMDEVTSSLVFVRTRAQSGELANELSARGFAAEALNGDLAQEARERTLNRFRQNKISVLVATDVAARGLDIDDISHVFNFDLPDDPEIYVHRIGRTGRAGKNGIAIALISPFEKRHLRQIEIFAKSTIKRANLPSEEDISKQREERLVGQVQVWLQRGRCKREREIVEKLAAEGHDPLEIAAVALKMARSEEKQRPIAAVSEVVESKPTKTVRSTRLGQHAEQVERYTTVSHEPGMVRLSLNIGKKHGIRPNDIVGAIAATADIPGHAIGKIHIQEKNSLVDVPEDLVAQVLGKSRSVRIRKQAVDMQRA
jgi:ATP-dependent RNA helicase DeaD